MPNPFENYTFEQASENFAKLKVSLEKCASNRKFVEGDDWQSGGGWVGPQFDGAGKMSRELKKAIEREFTSKGSIRAAVRRHQRGVIGRVPNWQISSRRAPADPMEQEQADDQLIGEAQIALNEFWKNSRVHQTLKDAVTDFLSTGHAVLRLFFVQSGEGETSAARSVEDAVKLLHLFREEPEAGVVVCDKETLKRASFFRYEKGGMQFIEMCYTDDDGKTVFKTLSRNDSKSFAEKELPTLGKYIAKESEETNETTLPLNGKMLVFEMSGEPFITPAMRSQQKLINKGYTMLSHNLDVSGFRERVYLNAMPPGAIEIDPAGKKTFKPDADGVEVGAGKVSYTQGLEVTERDVEGKIKKTYTSPGVFESDPIPVQTYVDTVDAGSDAILEEADQKHIAITGDAAASGESRKEAREAYKQSLEDTKSTLDDVVSDVFETVLAIVAYLMGQDDRYKDLQVTFSAILNPGPVSVEERRVAREEADNLYRSRESAMEEIGVADPDAMKARIEQEKSEERTMQT